METKNVYPNIDFTRSVIEDEDGTQKMFIALSTVVRFKNELQKGTIVTLGITYDIDADIEDSYTNEMILSTEFHKMVVEVYENGFEAIKKYVDDPQEFDVDDPRL
jgi:hypothetical protein